MTEEGKDRQEKYRMNYCRKGKRPKEKYRDRITSEKNICQDDFYLQRIVTFSMSCNFCDNSVDMELKLVVLASRYARLAGIISKIV